MKHRLIIAILSVPLLLNSCLNGENTVSVGEFTITTPTELSFDANRASSQITYITPEGEDGPLAEAISDQSWITIDENSTYGVINYTVEGNLSEKERTGHITLSYQGESIMVNISQESFSDSVVEVEYQATTLWGIYYGKRFSSDAANYWIYLSQDGIDSGGNLLPDGETYRIDIYAPVCEDSENPRIPDGAYRFDKENTCSTFTFSAENSIYTTTDHNTNPSIFIFQDATLTVDGNEIILIATINDQLHRVTFNSEYSLRDMSLPDHVSTLTDDLILNLESGDLTIQYMEDWWNCGYPNWYVELFATVGEYSHLFILDLISGSDDPESGFLGTFEDSGFSVEDPTKPNFAPYTFVPGMRISLEGHLLGSLYLGYHNGSQTDQAPLVEGTITISKNGDGTYSIKIEAIDDLDTPNKLSISWTGNL